MDLVDATRSTVDGLLVCRPYHRPRSTRHDHAKASVKVSPLTLPPELRNRIYSYVLPAEPQEMRFSFSLFPKVPALTQVNRHARAEVLGLYYGTCTFDFVIHHRNFSQWKNWVQNLTPQSIGSLLRNHHVVFRVIFDEYHPDFAAFKRLLGAYTFSFARYRWYISAEHRKDERRPTASLIDVEELRRARADARGARPKREALTKNTKSTAVNEMWELSGYQGWSPGAPFWTVIESVEEARWKLYKHQREDQSAGGGKLLRAVMADMASRLFTIVYKAYRPEGEVNKGRGK